MLSVAGVAAFLAVGAASAASKRDTAAAAPAYSNIAEAARKQD